jgi:hypothetical protein
MSKKPTHFLHGLVFNGIEEKYMYLSCPVFLFMVCLMTMSVAETT